MTTKNISLYEKTEYTVAPRSVEQIIVKPTDGVAGLNMTVAAGAGAQLILPATPVNSTYNIEVAAEAQFTLSLLGLVESDKTADINIVLKGQRAIANIELAVIAQGNSVIKFNIFLEHRAANTVGRIMARRVQYQKTVSELIGTLAVGLEAHGTDTYLSDKALLLGELAQARSDPRLEIKASDVKASHGATIGQLDQTELFYLRSRGLSEDMATAILVQSFLNPALVGVPLEVRDKYFHAISIR